MLPKPVQEQPRNAKQLLIDELSGLRAKIYSATADDSRCFEVLMRQVKRLIAPEATGCADLADLAEVKRWLNNIDNQPDHIDVNAVKETMLKIAAALKSAGDARGAIEIGWANRHAVKFPLRESAEDYLKQALKLLEKLLDESQSLGGSPSPVHLDSLVQQRATKLTFDCKLSLADLILDQAERDPQDGGPVDSLASADKRCEEAKKILEDYSHPFPDDVPRAGQPSTFAAPGAYTCRRGTCDDTHHEKYYRDLEDARAEAYVGQGEEDRELMAEIRLRTAEGLKNQATCRLSPLKQDLQKDERVPDVKVRVDDIQDLLSRTLVHLEQARSALSDGHSNFKRWYLWGQLRRRCDDIQLDLTEVQLKHTESLLSALEESRSANDLTTLKQTETLLTRARTALSISPPSSEVWDKWKQHHKHWTDLQQFPLNLSCEKKTICNILFGNWLWQQPRSSYCTLSMLLVL